MSMNLNTEIETLKQMTVHELQDRYIDVFGERTRSNHRRQWLFAYIQIQLSNY